MNLHTELLPADYVSALASLQDHVAPFPGGQAVREIERSFGRPITDLYAALETTPLAASSIAQVHAARLCDGREVIVKVRRPGIKRQIEQDMKIMAFLVRAVLVVAPGWRRFEPLGLIAETLRNVRQEIDFWHEARSIRRFAATFEDSPTIFVPPAIDGLQSEWVGVQHMSAGMRIDDPRLQESGPKLAQALVDAYLKQFLRSGALTAIPVPATFHHGRRSHLLARFRPGLLSRRNTRRHLAALIQAFVLQDAEWLLDAALDLGLLHAAPTGQSSAAGSRSCFRTHRRVAVDAILHRPAAVWLPRTRGPRLRPGRSADGACRQRRRREMMYLGLSLTSAGTLLMLGLLSFRPG